MTEATFSRKVQAWLKARHCWVVKFHASSYTPKGVPDLLVCYKGAFIGIELKTGSRVSDWQEYQGVQISKAGGQWLVLAPSDFPHKLLLVLGSIDNNGQCN